MADIREGGTGGGKPNLGGFTGTGHEGIGTGANQGDGKVEQKPSEHRPEQGPTPAQAEGNQFAKPPVATGGTVH